MVGNVGYGCGQCTPCRINRRRLWSWRMVLESYCHDHSSFVTLTYSDDELPEGGSLVPSHLSGFMKRLRFHSGTQLRFFGVGEYGDATFRPHYHVAVFGLSPLRADLVSRSWTAGHSSAHELNEATAAYVAGYCLKKMTGRDDPRLGGRHPEFARMSLRPGIGALAVKALAQSMASDAGIRETLLTGDVPAALLLARKRFPLGRYIRRKLRNAMGLSESFVAPAKSAFTLRESQSVQALQLAALENGEGYLTARQVVARRDAQAILNVESRSRVRSSRRSL